MRECSVRVGFTRSLRCPLSRPRLRLRTRLSRPDDISIVCTEIDIKGVQLRMHKILLMCDNSLSPRSIAQLEPYALFFVRSELGMYVCYRLVGRIFCAILGPYKGQRLIGSIVGDLIWTELIIETGTGSRTSAGNANKLRKIHDRLLVIFTGTRSSLSGKPGSINQGTGPPRGWIDENLCDKITHTGVARLRAPSNSRRMGT